MAVSDADGGLLRRDGLDIDALDTAVHRDARGSPLQNAGVRGDRITNDELLPLDVDILIPAAIDGVINGDNVDDVRAGMVVEAANAPVTCEALAALGS